MTLDEFYLKIKKLMPYHEDMKFCFKKRLNNALKEYLILADAYIKDKGIIDDIKEISSRLADIVSQYEKGLHSSAYVKLQNLIQGKKGLASKVDLLKTMLENDGRNGHLSFYRIRVMESIYERKAEDMFHIPLDKRGCVKTQRYSAPGYPCLYLGESIYGCWEEMRRPAMQTCAVSRFECDTPLNIINLSVPDKKEYLDMPDYQRLIPLIISCMIPVANYDDTYKPEYIIPQLIMQWVLKNRKGKDIDGICYTSTHISGEFGFPEEKSINYAFPAYNITDKNNYCRRLCAKFKVTDPTTNEIEKLKGNYGSNFGVLGLSEKQQKEYNYKVSDFGSLEGRLSDPSRFPLKSISHKG